MVYKEVNNQDEVIDSVVITRVCKKCNLRKSFEEFHFTTGRKNRRRTCKKCSDDMRRAYQSSDPELKKYRARRNHLRKKYGISVEEFDRMWDCQGGACMICKREMVNDLSLNTPMKVQVDHCHESGRVRGLLCFVCNTGLGKFKDSVDILKSAIEYLENPPEIIYRGKSVHASEDARGKWARGKIRVDYSNMDIPIVGRTKGTPFSQDDRMAIRKEYSSGRYSQTYLAIRWNAHVGTISKIINEKS